MKIKAKYLDKLFTSFSRSGDMIARVLETNFPEGYPNNLPFYQGIHTVKLTDHPDKTDNPSKAIAKDIFPHNIYKGYHSVDGEAIHFLGKKHKLVKTLVRSFYHIIADDLAEIVYALNIKPDVELIINISDVADNLERPEWDMVRFFLECLDKKKIKYTVVDFSKFDVVYIENFTNLVFPFHSGARLDMLTDFLIENVSGTIPPTGNRKLFVSRRNTMVEDFLPDAVNFSHKNDRRIDNAENLEKIFSDLGFEIVYAESLGTFEDQIRFFADARVVAGVTGSGLTNALFMRPGGVLIEISTPLITHSPMISAQYFKKNKIDPIMMSPNPNMVQEIHMFYHNLAFFKNLLYVSIPNFSRESDQIREFIESIPGLKEFITHDPQSNNL